MGGCLAEYIGVVTASVPRVRTQVRLVTGIGCRRGSPALCTWPINQMCLSIKGNIDVNDNAAQLWG